MALVKLSVSGTILYFVLSLANLDRLLVGARRADPMLLCAAWVCFMVGLWVCAIRYFELLSGNVAATRGNVIRYYYVGHFFNMFLPGGVMGDVARALHTARHGAGGTFSAFAIVLERVMGLFALATVGGLLLLTTAQPIALAAGAKLMLLLVVAAGIGATTVVLTRAYRKLNSISILARRVVPNLDRFGASALWMALLLSLVNACLTVLFHWLLALSLHMPIDLVVLGPIVAVSSILSQIPVSFQGLGVREGILLFLLAGHGVPPDRAILLGVLVFLVGAGAGLVGGVLYLRRTPAV